MVLLSSLASFVASTRLIRSRMGAIDSPDQSRQVFEQYNTSEVVEKISQATFRWLVIKKMLIFGIFKAFISNFAYHTITFTKRKVK